VLPASALCAVLMALMGRYPDFDEIERRRGAH
jgi:hypothetical protein